MFRSKRSVLIKRLAKYRKLVPRHEASCSLEDDLEPRSAVHNMLKRLKEVQLEALVRAVESGGTDEPSSCVLVPKGDLRLGRQVVAPHVLCCQLWRWPDLASPQELKCLTHLCDSANDSLYICCNPYHWSRLCKPDSPPPPYSRLSHELFKDEESTSSEPVSLETGGTNHYGSFQSHISGCGEPRRSKMPWCNIAYWEHSSRVGRLFPVIQPAVNVFSDLPRGDGLCLGTLAENHPAEHPSVVQTRSKIGHGITLVRTGSSPEVWLYNRSDYPVFVNSPTLDPPNTRPLTVYKVPSGHTIKIFDYEKCEYNKRMQKRTLHMDGPFDPHSVRISFAKGFGSSRYSRQFVTSCPCWLEVMFVVNR